EPRRRVTAAEVETISDADARENYAVLLRFRERLLAASTLEAFYATLFHEDIAVPPDFIYHTAQVILRSMLEGTGNGLEARAAELFFRMQRVTVNEGSIMLADAETVARHATSGGFGDLGRLLREGAIATKTVDLDVLDAESAGRYFERDERF